VRGIIKEKTKFFFCFFFFGGFFGFGSGGGVGGGGGGGLQTKCHAKHYSNYKQNRTESAAR